MTTQWQHEILPLLNYKSDIEKTLDDKSKEGWETISVFSMKLGIEDNALYALLRKIVK